MKELRAMALGYVLAMLPFVALHCFGGVVPALLTLAVELLGMILFELDSQS